MHEDWGQASAPSAGLCYKNHVHLHWGNARSMSAAIVFPRIKYSEMLALAAVGLPYAEPSAGPLGGERPRSTGSVLCVMCTLRAHEMSILARPPTFRLLGGRVEANAWLTLTICGSSECTYFQSSLLDG